MEVACQAGCEFWLGDQGAIMTPHQVPTSAILAVRFCDAGKPIHARRPWVCPRLVRLPAPRSKCEKCIAVPVSQPAPKARPQPRLPKKRPPELPPDTLAPSAAQAPAAAAPPKPRPPELPQAAAPMPPPASRPAPEALRFPAMPTRPAPQFLPEPPPPKQQTELPPPPAKAGVNPSLPASPMAPSKAPPGSEPAAAAPSASPADDELARRLLPRRTNPLTGESSEGDPAAEPLFPGLFDDIEVIDDPGAEDP